MLGRKSSYRANGVAFWEIDFDDIPGDIFLVVTGEDAETKQINGYLASTISETRCRPEAIGGWWAIMASKNNKEEV